MKMYARELPAEFKEFRESGFSGFRRNDSAVPEIGALLDRFSGPEARLCKNSAKVRAGIIDGFFIKRYLYRNFSYLLRHRFTLPRPWTVLAAAERLNRFQIDTPRILAIGERKILGFTIESFFVSGAVAPAAISCDRLLKGESGDSLFPALQKELVLLLSKMHAAGVEHGDLNLRNIFCFLDKQQQPYRCTVIDLDSCKLYRHPLSPARRRRELARLISSCLRLRRGPDNGELPPDTAAVTAGFTGLYCEFSGFDLNDGKLAKRVRYLTCRIRKTQPSSGVNLLK